MIALVLGGLITLAALRHVYRGGRTWNDHAVALVVAGCVAVYPLLWLGLQAQAPPAWLQALLGTLLGVGAFCIYILFFILDRRVEAGSWMPLAKLSQLAYAFSLWAGLLLTIWIPAAGLGRLLDLGRLEWLWPGQLLWIPTLLALWGTAWTYLRHGKLRTLQLGEGDEPICIVHLSDIHASPCMTGRDLAEMVRRSNALEPDLVLMTGDFVMPFSEAHHSYLVEALAELKAPSFACPGNHDLPILDRLVEELEEVGVRWLVDAATVIEIRGQKLELVGVNFHWKGAREKLLRALEALPAIPGMRHRILLAHDPRLFGWLPEGRFDLQLSGHTHGGQVGTDMFGIRWSVLRPLGVFDQGLFERQGTLLNVHRGNWHTGLPPRMGIASEIVRIEIS